MATKGARRKESLELDRLIDEIIVDAYGDDEQLWAFRRAFKDKIAVPAEAFVIGEPVTVIAIDYDGNVRRGLRAKCRRKKDVEQVIAACDLIFPEDSVAARYVAAYRKWLGIEPYLQGSLSPTRSQKATQDDIDISRDIELIVVAVKGNAVSCRILGNKRVLTVRPTGHWDMVPGEIILVAPRKHWRYGGHPYLSGEIKTWRLDIPALGLTPLKLKEEGTWDPKDHYWGEPDEPIEDWAKPIIKRGSRPEYEYEMEQVLPGENPDDPDTDPILDAVELKEAGDYAEAQRMLMSLLSADLRCLDAHAHLGNFAFDHSPKKTIRHYEVGVRLGEFSLGQGFDGVLHWGYVNNRPFLRCLHGYGLCLSNLGRHKEAAEVFTRMLWLNPTDNQGSRFLLGKSKKGKVITMT